MLNYNKSLKSLSRTLRSNMTDYERILWTKLKGKQLKNTQFYRQKIIGNYIADFYCPKAKIIIEIDGSQHYQKEEIKNDKDRDCYFQSLGLKVLRFSNNEIKSNLMGVVDMLYELL